MKKLLVILLAAAVVIMFSTCTKSTVPQIKIKVANMNSTYTVCVKKDGVTIATIPSNEIEEVTIDKDACLKYYGYDTGSCASPDAYWFSENEQCYSQDENVTLN
jgi:hypothetical protein